MITLKLAGYDSKSATALRDIFSDGVTWLMSSPECRDCKSICAECDFNYPCSNLTNAIEHLNKEIEKMRAK